MSIWNSLLLLYQVLKVYDTKEIIIRLKKTLFAKTLHYLKGIETCTQISLWKKCVKFFLKPWTGVTISRWLVYFIKLSHAFLATWQDIIEGCISKSQGGSRGSRLVEWDNVYKALLESCELDFFKWLLPDLVFKIIT